MPEHSADKVPRSTLSGLRNSIGLFYWRRYIFLWFMQLRRRQAVSGKCCRVSLLWRAGIVSVEALSMVCGSLGDSWGERTEVSMTAAALNL